jgi:hypothetical protein
MKALMSIRLSLSAALIALLLPFAAYGEISPFDLIWDIDVGTTSNVGARETTETVFSVAPLASTSSCEVDLDLDVYDFKGNLLDSQPVVLSAASPSFVSTREGGGALRNLTKLHGPGTGRNCTAAEIANLASSVTLYDTATGRTIAEWPVAFKAEQQDPAKLSRYRDGASPFDLIWDLAGGTTSDVAKDETAQWSFDVIPLPATSSCAIDLIVDVYDAAGNLATKKRVTLSAKSPAFVLTQDGRSLLAPVTFKMTGKGRGCFADEIANLVSGLSLYQTTSGRTVAERPEPLDVRQSTKLGGGVSR